MKEIQVHIGRRNQTVEASLDGFLLGEGKGVELNAENIKTALGYTPADQKDVDNLYEEIADLKENGAGSVTPSGWTTGQINLLDQLFSCIPWTNSGAGSIADSLIASLKSTSSGGSSGDTETEAEDVITQSGSVLTISSLRTEPTQSGSVLSIA